MSSSSASVLQDFRQTVTEFDRLSSYQEGRDLMHASPAVNGFLVRLACCCGLVDNADVDSILADPVKPCGSSRYRFHVLNLVRAFLVSKFWGPMTDSSVERNFKSACDDFRAMLNDVIEGCSLDLVVNSRDRIMQIYFMIVMVEETSKAYDLFFVTKERKLAVCMALNPRLGASSPLAGLHSELVQLIADKYIV